ncbi:MAG: response regulator [Candidatus Marinimicrobia bacterium]|nr:response regulator [Candidatus Neomarinimicrobiota bacterium]MCF7830185.1 response regulator [Candidatus Neomarinimicrobiota bacterium]MCF7882081.1 response regulator [Candidatus Neomarinimicrobiota bacterium]
MVETESKKLMVVDDDQGVRDMLSEFLAGQDYDVTTCKDGEHALEAMREQTFDLVISDLRMPGVDGLEVIQHYKESYEDGIGIIITGLATVESAVDALRLGVDDFVLKPFNLKHLSDILDKAFDLRRIQEENRRLQQQIKEERDELKKTVTVLEIIKSIALKMNYNFSFSDLILLVMKHIARVVRYDYSVFVDTRQEVIFTHSDTPLNKQQKITIARIAAHTLKEKYDFGQEIKKYKFISDSTASHDDSLPEIKSTLSLELSSEDDQAGIIIALGTDEAQFRNVEESFLEQLSRDVTQIFDQFWHLLTEQKHRIQLLVDNLSDGVVLIDVFAKEIVFNPAAAEIFERHSSAFTIESFLETLGFDMTEIKEACFKNDEVLQQIVDLEIEDQKKVLDVQVKGFKYSGYMEEGIVFSVRDITKKSQVEKMKANLIANVSHELKTPIAIIKEFLSLLEDGIGGELNEQQMEFVQISNVHLDRLDRLIYNFLNLSKLDSGRLYIKPSLYNMNTIIDEAVEPLKYRIGQENITLQKKYDTDIPETQIDRDAFLQIMMNLLDNAIKYSPEEGTITVGTRNDNGEILVWVKDEGKGIAKENVDKVFERFYQELWDENKPPGTGLGLAITRQLVEEHGGEIWAESPDDAGAHFYLKIPVRQNSEMENRE